MTDDAITVFTRFPEAGGAKTRLIPALGPYGAARVHRHMTEAIIAEAACLAKQRAVALRCAYCGGGGHDMRQWLGPGVELELQTGADLGARMAASFTRVFAAGARRALVIGSDCPALTSAAMSDALDRLHSNDMVLTPATDGGYVLIGLRRQAWPRAKAVFTTIPWGSSEVFGQSVRRAETVQLQVALQDALPDVDRPQDLPLWRERAAQPDIPAMAVVIPTLNEEPALRKTLERLRYADGIDAIVADGGSTDDTCAIARSMGARVVTTAAGRGAQLNLGAAATDANILLFLHADTLPPMGFDRRIRAALAAPDAGIGAFALTIDHPGPGFRLLEHLVRLRVRLLGLPYGDQALFCTRALFDRVGGFPHMPIMEDFEFVRRCRRHGRAIALPVAVTTSPRRWEEHGMLKVTAVNALMVVAYLAGVPPSALARFYRGRRRPAGTTAARD